MLLVNESQVDSCGYKLTDWQLYVCCCIFFMDFIKATSDISNIISVELNYQKRLKIITRSYALKKSLKFCRQSLYDYVGILSCLIFLLSYLVSYYVQSEYNNNKHDNIFKSEAFKNQKKGQKSLLCSGI